jgi:hypothetical protein
MNKVTLFIGMLCFSISLYSQSIDERFYDYTNKAIDKEYERENNQWKTNYEWGQIIAKYMEIWKHQVALEYERIDNSLNGDAKIEFNRIHTMWTNNYEEYISFIYNNVETRYIGRETYIIFANSIMKKYRDKALEYFALFYAMKLKNGDELDSIKFELAK